MTGAARSASTEWCPASARRIPAAVSLPRVCLRHCQRVPGDGIGVVPELHAISFSGVIPNCSGASRVGHQIPSNRFFKHAVKIAVVEEVI